MKKIMILLCCFSLAFTSCQGDDDGDNGLSCSEATQNAAIALTNYTNAGSTNFEDLCNAYKLTLQQQKDACGDPSGTIQDIIDNLGDCTSDDVGVGNN